MLLFEYIVFPHADIFVFSEIANRAKRSIHNEELWESILYAYKIDPSSPSFLTKGNKIFNVPNKNGEIVMRRTDSQVYMESTHSTSEKTAAKQFAASVAVSGSSGAFEAAASMQVSKTSSKSIKTQRIDAFARSKKFQLASVGSFRNFPQRFLTEDFIRAVRDLTVEEIERRIGVFYAMRMDLGGEIRTSFIVQETAGDTQNKIASELTASYGSDLMGVSVAASTSIGTRSSNRNAQQKTMWCAKGGDPNIWMRHGSSSVRDLQDKWAESLSGDNADLYSFNYELGQVWKLVKHVDERKGRKFKQYLEAKWESALNEFTPTDVLPR